MTFDCDDYSSSKLKSIAENVQREISAIKFQVNICANCVELKHCNLPSKNRDLIFCELYK
jgi:hypothetical protein